jgi:hypothetical protein
MRNELPILALLTALCTAFAAEKSDDWRPLPLVQNGKPVSDWVQIGYGGWTVDDGALRTAPAPEGLGLLLYKKEKLGNCQIRVVFRQKEARSNSGIYVRIDDGVLDQLKNPGATYARDASGKPSAESTEKMKASSERDEGPWYGVNHGYEIQIAGTGGNSSGTASVYSLAASKGPLKAEPGKWHTMVITLDGEKIAVDFDGVRTTEFDAATAKPGPRTQWFQPNRAPKRPQVGYIGLQTHDPDDIVWFKEVSVRPLGHSARP